MRKRVNKNGKNDFEDINLSKYEIGDIRIKIYAFDRDSSILNNFIPIKLHLKTILMKMAELVYLEMV